MMDVFCKMDLHYKMDLPVRPFRCACIRRDCYQGVMDADKFASRHWLQCPRQTSFPVQKVRVLCRRWSLDTLFATWLYSIKGKSKSFLQLSDEAKVMRPRNAADSPPKRLRHNPAILDCMPDFPTTISCRLSATNLAIIKLLPLLEMLGMHESYG